MDRESVDLTPMVGYDDELEDALGDSEFATYVENSFNELNDIYSKIQNECCDIFNEELMENVKSASKIGNGF